MKNTTIYELENGWLLKVEVFVGSSESYELSRKTKKNDIFRLIRPWKNINEENK